MRHLLNLKIKYPRNFLHTRSRSFVQHVSQHVHVMGKWLALWKYLKRATKVNTHLPSPIVAVYFEQYFSSNRATNKEVQRVIDTINGGTLYLATRSPYTSTLRGKGANQQIATLLITPSSQGSFSRSL